MDRSSLHKAREDSSLGYKRKTTLVEVMLSTRSSIRYDNSTSKAKSVESILGRMSDEQSQIDRITDFLDS